MELGNISKVQKFGTFEHGVLPCHLVPVLLEAVLHLLLFVPNGVFMKMVFKQFLEIV